MIPVQSQRENLTGSVLVVGLLGFLAMLYLPLLMVFIFSFNSGRFQVFPLKEFSLQWYQRLIQDPAFVNALGHSLGLGLAVSLTATVLGFLGAYSLIKGRFPGQEFLASFLVTPLAVPGILLGIALRVYFFRLGWSFSLFTVYLGHLIFGIPLAMLIVRARLLQIPNNLEEAAWDLGAKRLNSLWEVIVPLSIPGIMASLLLNFTFSFDEFVMAYFLTQFDQTLPIKIWTNLITGFDPTVNAVGSMICLLSLTLGLIAQFLLSKPSLESN